MRRLIYLPLFYPSLNKYGPKVDIHVCILNKLGSPRPRGYSWKVSAYNQS